MKPNQFKDFETLIGQYNYTIRLLLEIGKMQLMERDAPGVVGQTSFAQQNSIINASIHKSIVHVYKLIRIAFHV